MPRTLKNLDGISWPSWLVQVAKTPSGKVNAHHPRLNGNFFNRIMAATAKNSHIQPNDHRRRPIRKPMSYKVSPDPGLNVPVSGKTFCAAVPNFWILYRKEQHVSAIHAHSGHSEGTHPNPPWPRGPRGKNVLTITAFCGSLYSMRRIK